MVYTTNAQVCDTVYIAFDEVIMLEDTVYFGITDSMIILEKGTEYESGKNFLIRNPSYYVRKPEKREAAIRLHNKYGNLLMSQIRSKQETLPEDFNPSDSYYTFYENRPIKDIIIEGVPVLDGNVFDTTNVAVSGFGRFLNKTYSPTKEHIIRNNLKFSKNDRIDPRIFSDNERLLRTLPYIEDAVIQFVPVDNGSDSVNVIVVVKDKYPIGVRGDINDYNAFEVEPYTRNLLGGGHYIGAALQYDGSADEKFGYGMYYSKNNISGTFVDGAIAYQDGLDKDIFRMELSRPFVTTNTKYGGELIYEKRTEKISERPNIPDSIYAKDAKYSRNLTDLWAGYSFFIEEDYTKPFVNLAGRLYYENYTDRPEELLEYNYLFHDRFLNLLSVSLQQLSYIKTTKLIQFGNIEDVPIGFNTSFTAGWEHTSYFSRPYVGARLNYSRYSQSAGIFSAGINMGGYIYKSDFEDAVTAFHLSYLSPLVTLKDLEVRNILDVTYNAVHNPRYMVPIIYSDYFEMDKEDQVYGDASFTMIYQPVLYTQYQYWGFRFSFSPFVHIGWVNQAESMENSWESFTQIGVNLSTKNESLIFPAMHLHFGYYSNKITNEPRWEFSVIFKDIKLFKDFSSLKPETAFPYNSYR